jgi:GT2 family glycosyltransferase/glycosyltransferase involved in cell wall biosynthesis
MADAPSINAAEVERLLGLIVDPVWYRARHRDVAASGVDPLRHFIDVGLRERRDPNRWFDGAWYARQYADVAASGTHPLLHYMSEGARMHRDPHPRFDAGWYADQHPEAAGNPLLFHLRVGAARAYLTEQPVVIDDWLPSAHAPFPPPDGVAADVVIPVYRDFTLTRQCVESVLADDDRPDGRVVVIDDCSPEAKLRAWLERLAKTGAITLLRHDKNLGFVAAINHGIRVAGTRDVVLLNSDTEVPRGWLRRLMAQAYAADDIATVSPLSNNASICSYLSYEGGPIPAGMTLRGLDDACRVVNAGRFADAPTTVGFCMYIRCAALAQIGRFDRKTFGKGYGEENDFCLRASAAGWRHHIACDTFVRHAGAASFGAASDAGIARAYRILTKRYPDYPLRVALHARDAETAPFRFAITMALFRASGLPTILMLSHGMDGGVRRHIDDRVADDKGRANYLLIEPASRGIAVSVPGLPGHPRLVLAAERWRDVAAVARSAGVTRVHIQHLMGNDLDARALIDELGVPFDVTLHDWFAICPQVTLLPLSYDTWCGEPGPAGCDACIANRPSHGATDILSWRLRWSWQFHQAERVFAPSQDALERLRRHGVGENSVLAPHEATPAGPWRMRPPARLGERMRIAVLGALANHKGAQLMASVAVAADPARFEWLVIGDVEADIPDAARKRLTVHGRYREGELPALLAKYRPHLVWFPQAWPETWSFTLSAAIDAGLPIAASEIGVFPERLAGRPLTWLIPPTLDPAVWLAQFDTIRQGLHRRGPVHATRQPVVRTPVARRRAATISVLVIPETFDNGAFTPCAHIRLLRPLDHPRIGHGLSVTLADGATVAWHRADAIVTQRHAVATDEAAEALAAHAKRTGAALIYDLDDDLLTVPPDHPEAAELMPKAAVVERMIRLADVTLVSTETLARRVASLARETRIMPNALDERIWRPRPRARDPYGVVRILCTGTLTHDADFTVVLPALEEIHRRFGEQVQLELIGFTSITIPGWIRRVAPTLHASRSYPGFVHWLTGSGPWDIGLAPLADSAFNASKSAIKALDYAALGLAILASDVPAYRGSLADGPGGQLVSNSDKSWYEALSRLIRDAAARRRLGTAAVEHLIASGTLSTRQERWADALKLTSR